MARDIDAGGDPQAPGPQLPEPSAPTTLSGPLGVRWRALGGVTWGRPAFKPQKVPGGSFVTFTLADNTANVTMYSSAAGVFVVTERINAAWRRLGQFGGTLGFPVSDELKAHRGGAYQRFQNGMVVWHSSTGAFGVQGPILATYTALGGSAWGYPTTDVTPIDGGWFSHFRSADTGAELSIYATPQSGAFALHGPIRQKWAAMGWERSPLGYPVSDELPTGVDPHGRYTTFQHGLIVYHPSHGAHAITGAIDTRYRQLGGAGWGYPITDVTTLKAGGQYLHLVHPTIGDERSIYWHPSTGAHEVLGKIRGKWSGLGWQKSHLGFPTGPPEPFTEPNSDGGSVVQRFQHGRIIAQPRRGTYTSPALWTRPIKAGGFSGEVRVTATDDGTVALGGYVRSDALAGFRYLVKATLTDADKRAVVVSASGSVSGTHGTDEKDELSASVHSDIVRRRFPEFAQGSVTLDHRHDNLLTGALGDVFEGIVTWGVGTLAITPGVGLVIVAGAAVVSAIGAQSLVPGAQILSGTLWLAGPSGLFIALAADALVRLATDERELTVEEYAYADRVFKGSLPPRSDIRITDATGAGGHHYTFPRFDRKIVLNLGDDWKNPIQAYVDRDRAEGQHFIHELTHAWQYHNDPTYLEYVADGIAGRLKTFAPGEEYTEDWSSYNIEQQGVIVDRWFGEHHNGTNADDDHGLSSKAARRDPRFRYIELLRRGRT